MALNNTPQRKSTLRMSLISEEVLSPEIQKARRMIDEQLARYCEFHSDCPEHLADAIRYSLLAPGKRIRPLLVLMACEACRGDIEKAIPAACAVEMVHTYSLIHDDLPAMDDDDMRRGRPSCHIAFDEATAILAGDALLTLAFEVLGRDVQPATSAAACCAALGRAAGAIRLVGGQAADLAGADDVPQAELLDWLERVHHRKTGALLTVSLQLGCIVAGGGPEKLAAMKNYGKNLGLAFQIVDDLLDLCGSQAKIGKPVGSDANHGKTTYPQLLGVEESRQRAQTLIEQAIDSISIFGQAAENLNRLARFVIKRNS